jgi:hypothetical protein
MKSYAKLVNLFSTLSQNNTSAGQQLGAQLMNDQHRYLIERFFDNERSFQTTTVGAMSLTLTGAPAINAVSATLTVAWAYPTVSQFVNFSNSNQRTALFTNGSTAITWTGGLSSAATTAISTVGVQRYKIPATISKIKNSTISIGQLKYVPWPVESRNDWDLLNFLPYTSDIVNYFFIYAGNIEFFPIPSSTGNIIQFNYQARTPDFSFIYGNTSGGAWTAGSQAFDYQAGTITPPAVGATQVTGSGTAWNTTGGFPLNTDVSIFNLFLVINAGQGDGLWYPISQFNSDTSLTLASVMENQVTTAGGASYSIAQLPLLAEDFHDLIAYGALKLYFATIRKDKEQFELFDTLYKERMELLENYGGTKEVNVDLGSQITLLNPNLFPYSN